MPAKIVPFKKTKIVSCWPQTSTIVVQESVLTYCSISFLPAMSVSNEICFSASAKLLPRSASPHSLSLSWQKSTCSCQWPRPPTEHRVWPFPSQRRYRCPKCKKTGSKTFYPHYLWCSASRRQLANVLLDNKLLLYRIEIEYFIYGSG